MKNLVEAQSDTLLKPSISFTFDDGSIDDQPHYKLETWNSMLLSILEKYSLKAILFSTGEDKTSEAGKYVLESWNNAGHSIANHTMTHPNFSKKKVSLELFEKEFILNDNITRQYSNYLTYFRFPYLKEGETQEKIDGFRLFLRDKGYKNGYVTIDASDWYINSRLCKRLKHHVHLDVSKFREYYIEHHFECATYYEDLSYQLTHRHIHHVLLLHHNLAAALFLGEMIIFFKQNGWNVTDPLSSYRDQIYETTTHNIPEQESLILAMATESGKFQKQLMHQPEDKKYLRKEMNKRKL